MRTWKPPKIVLVSVLGLAACATMLGSLRPTGKGSEIIHSHSHPAHKDLPCEMCHDGVGEATTVGNALLPREEKCLTCHTEHKDSKNCGFCHQNPKKPRTYPAAEQTILFSHKDHADRGTSECATCHKDLSDSGRSLGRPPTMGICADCHKDQIEDGSCSKCHKDLHKYPLKPISEFSHGGDYVRQHRLTARSGSEGCAKCHDERFCADCHGKTNRVRVEVKFAEDVDRDFIHRGDYVARHAIEAKADPSLCNRCHGVSYCRSCHALNSRTPGVLSPRSPHPPGYANPGPTSHAFDAKRDITTCASCHDQGSRSNCINCHRVGGIGGNPHPSGWDKQHSIEESRSRTVCLNCH